MNCKNFQDYLDILENDEGKQLPDFLIEILEEVYNRDKEQFKIIFERTYKRELIDLS